MEVRFLKDALFNGMTANAFKLGTVLSLGWFWQRPSGCHTVYSGQAGVMDYDYVLAVMELDDEQVTIPFQYLPENSTWNYIRRQVSDCGLESDDSADCIVHIGPDGEILNITRPNTPLNLTAALEAGGKVRLRWRYSPDGEEISPTGFNIYIDSGEGFDFETPSAVVSYRFTPEFTWLSGALEDGVLHRFCVRAYSNAAGAGETLNTNSVAAIPDSVGPAAITDITASWVET